MSNVTISRQQYSNLIIKLIKEFLSDSISLSQYKESLLTLINFRKEGHVYEL